MRIAHLSDLHFSKICFKASQLLSKRWLGNLNLLVSRQRTFDTDRLSPLIETLKNEKIDHLIITGDLSTTSLKTEFEMAARWIEKIENAHIRVHVLPGNHDHYTKKAYRQKLFYRYFPSDLETHRVSKTLLSPGWWLVRLDTALATSLFSSQGHFSHELEETLKNTLSNIPPKDKIILANHYPLFENEGLRKMQRAKELQNLLLKFPQITFYLHGHTHRHCVADLRPNGLPIILESGSPSHKERGTWHLLDMHAKGCQLQVYKYDDHKMWHPTDQFSFVWQH